jgi:hypothetical protein
MPVLGIDPPDGMAGESHSCVSPTTDVRQQQLLLDQVDAVTASRRGAPPMRAFISRK